MSDPMALWDDPIECKQSSDALVFESSFLYGGHRFCQPPKMFEMLSQKALC